MATIKSFSDLQQSKKLAEILPIESADYYHATDAGIVITAPYITYCGKERCVPAYKGAVPCWSLAALLNVLPNDTSLLYFDDAYQMVYDKKPYVISNKFDNPIDACYEMIIVLHSKNLL